MPNSRCNNYAAIGRQFGNIRPKMRSERGKGHQISSDGTWTYTYDADGNEATKFIPSTGEIWTYTYDVDNRLVKAEHKLTSTSAVDVRDQFSYNVLGNRISKTVGVGSPTTTKFAYDANGNAWVDFTGTSTIVARHIFGNGPDKLIANIAAGSTTWYLQDILGSTRDLTNASGALTDHLDYNSFGKLTYESNPGTADRYQWTSREVDVELGLQYNRARYYDANTQRWLSQDPLGFDAGDSNLYRYVNNGPTGATDPSGLQPGPENPRDFFNREKGEPGPYVAPIVKKAPLNYIPYPAGTKSYAQKEADAAHAEYMRNLLTPGSSEWNKAHAAGITDGYITIQKENYKLLKGTGYFVALLPGGQLALVPLTALEVAEGNYGTALMNVGTLGAGRLFRLAKGAGSTAGSGTSAGAAGVSAESQLIGNLQRTNPRNIRFTQATASPNLSEGPSGTITQLMESLVANPNNARNITLEVVEYRGMLFSLNNRRLAALQAAQISEVNIIQRSLTDPVIRQRFITQVGDGLIQDGQMIIIVQGKAAQAQARRFAQQHGALEFIPLPAK